MEIYGGVKMKKKIISLFLVIALLVALPIQTLAVSYSDLSGHWAKTYIEDLVSRDLLSGYSDGTMRPDKNMTTCELLVLLSRLYSLTDIQKEMIQSDYGAEVKESASSTVSWAYDNLAVCLASGILTENELKSLDLTHNADKEQFALLLVRALRLSDAAAALASTTLTYQDASEISVSCRGSVAELAALGIVKGDTKNQFQPKSYITRAVVAAMVSRSLDYIKTSNLTLSIPAYSGYARLEGILTAVDGQTIRLCGTDGLTKEFSMPAGAAVTVNGTSMSFSSIYEGDNAEVTTKNGAVTALAINADSSVKWVQGAISYTTSTTSASMIYVKDLETGKQTGYKVSSSASITQDGKSIALTSMLYNEFVTLKIQNDVVTQICSVSGDHELSGTISYLEYGTTVTLKVKDADGVVYCFTLDISTLPKIKRGDMTISIDRLKTGDAVTVTQNNCAVTLIQETGAENQVTGELTSITTTVSGTVWVLKTDSGSSLTLTLDEDVSVYSGTSEILLSDIQAGDQVTVVVYDNTISEVYLQSAVSSSTKVSGTVLSVDTTNRQITILTSSEKLIYINTASVVSILSAATGKTESLSSIVAKDLLVAYGTYSSSSAFTAKSIIIE